MAMTEVNSPETLVANLKAIATRATAEFQDADRAVARNKQEMANVEQTVANLTRFGFTPEHIQNVSALIDPCRADLTASTTKKAAAEKKKAAADKALKMAQEHLKMQQQGAAGAFYRGRQAGPVPAVTAAKSG